MANRLSSEKVAELWRSYSEGRQSVEEVSKKCGVHWKTVERYRRLERWDERLSEIRMKAAEEADYSLAKAMAESLKLARAYKSKLAAALELRQIAPEEVTAAELERLAKLESFLLGGADSRTELVSRFSGWTDTELERYASGGEQPSR